MEKTEIYTEIYKAEDDFKDIVVSLKEMLFSELLLLFKEKINKINSSLQEIKQDMNKYAECNQDLTDFKFGKLTVYLEDVKQKDSVSFIRDVIEKLYYIDEFESFKKEYFISMNGDPKYNYNITVITWNYKNYFD